MTTNTTIIHAAADKGPCPNFICGGVSGRVTRPGEYITCSECLEAVEYIHDRYPSRFSYKDIRPTEAERKRAARDFAADAYGGADD